MYDQNEKDLGVPCHAKHYLDKVSALTDPNSALHGNTDMDTTMHVASAYSNPFRWASRRKLFQDFRYHMETTKNVVFHAGELAYADRPFEVTGGHAGDAQFRTTSELFHKENIGNETIKTFPSGWKYGAFIDGDFTFTDPNWALEAIQLLQHYDFVQLFSTYANLSARGYGGSRQTRISESFAATYQKNGHKLPPLAGFTDGLGFAVSVPKDQPWVPVGATGGAWAFRRSAFDLVGGMLDQAILGHGDWFMAFGLVGEKTRGLAGNRSFHRRYLDMIDSWQARARLLNKNIGVLDQFAVHHHHGPMGSRGYESRDQILVDHQFDPVFDLRRNSQGIYELTGAKPELRDAIRRYFISRQEDSAEV